MQLKDARKATNLTQQELAQYVGVSQTIISMWEAGTDAPSADRRRIMDKVLKGRVDWINEFEPFDPVEQQAIEKFSEHMHKEIGEAATPLITRSTRYDMRRMLKGSGFLAREHIPAGAVEIMPDNDMLIAQKEKKT